MCLVGSTPQVRAKSIFAIIRWRERRKLSSRFRHERIGFVFQFYNFIPSLTALENVELVTELVPNPVVANEALRIVGLAERLDHFPSQLSGGEQQRFAIARSRSDRTACCATSPPAHSTATRKLVLEALAQANQALGTTVVAHRSRPCGPSALILHSSNESRTRPP
jgi:putative ABC transport system ATP-binding protein